MNLLQGLQKHCGAKIVYSRTTATIVQGWRNYHREIEGYRHQRAIRYIVALYISPVLSDTHYEYTIQVYSRRNTFNVERAFLADPSWSELIRSLEMLCNNVVNKSFYERN